MANMPEKNDYLWVVFGDIHEEISKFSRIPELIAADGVIITGDITNAGGVKQAEKVLESINEKTSVIYAQIGNMDRGEVTGWLEEKGWNIHGRVMEIAPGVALLGAGASTFTPFGTPSEFPESYFSSILEEGWKTARNYKLVVLVSHNPPKDTACDMLPNGIHVGSTAVREFIVENQPDICLCGHIHEARAIDRLGRTVVANAGTLNYSGYMVLRLNGKKLSVELKSLE